LQIAAAVPASFAAKTTPKILTVRARQLAASMAPTTAISASPANELVEEISPISAANCAVTAAGLIDLGTIELSLLHKVAQNHGFVDQFTDFGGNPMSRRT
jgi:hypothetical protein